MLVHEKECLFDDGSLSSEKSRIRMQLEEERREEESKPGGCRLQAGDRRQCSPH